MDVTRWMAVLCVFAVCAVVTGEGTWWNAGWRFHTTVRRPAPYRDDRPRPIEAAVDFPLLLKQAGIAGEFDPASVRVVESGPDGGPREVPCAYRTEVDGTTGAERGYVTWLAQPKTGQAGVADIYFDTKDKSIAPPRYDAAALPADNLVVNGGFEEAAGALPAQWEINSPSLVRLDKFAHTSGEKSLKIVVDENTPKDAAREVVLSQKLDVRSFAGQEMLFECDFLAERAAYGTPVSIEIQQFRQDGSRILGYAIEPRWLTLELAQGQFVQFSERGRFHPEAVTAAAFIRMRCFVRDADTGKDISGPETYFTVWLDRIVVRPGERWPWPEATNGGFAEGALKSAPLNRGFHFTGQRRLGFNGASEATLTEGKYNPDPKSPHWGVQAGTIEFWAQPSWDAEDGVERIFFIGFGYLYRVQSRLRKLDAAGKNQLEFTITDSDRKEHTVRGPAPLKKGQWCHIAATWDFAKAHVQLFVDGKRIAADGPGAAPWPCSPVAEGDAKLQGNGISENDKRSIPMQAFIGGKMNAKEWPPGDAAEAVLDEFRISDVARYSGDFTPSQEELPADANTRALWHFENERNGVHDSDDRFVLSYLGCEVPPQSDKAPIEVFADGKVERREVVVRPYAPAELFEANRAEKRIEPDRPFRILPDPRFIECQSRRVERTVTGANDDYAIQVGGDLPPIMTAMTFERAEGAPPTTTLLPRWRADDNVAPFSVATIAATLAPNIKDEAERAIATMKYIDQVCAYFDAHYCETLPSGLHRPRVSYVFLKALNIYPYDQCGPSNYTLRKLFLAVGISSNDSPGTHHQFQQAFYKGSWRLFDLSSRVYWLNRDNVTVIGLRGVGEDPYCKLRQPGGLNSFYPGRVGRASFGVATRPHSMDFPLRPGERAVIGWENEGKWFELSGEREPIPIAKIPPYFGNGTIFYVPTAEGEASALDNMTLDGAVLRAQDSAKAASLTYRAQCPYIFADGRADATYTAPEPGAVRLSLSFDEGKNWTEVWRNTEKAGPIHAALAPHIVARYAYWLKLDLAAGQGVTVTGLDVRTTFVVASLSLPEKLAVGDNRITFVFGKPSVPVKTTCSWIERRKSDLGVSLNAIGYYNADLERHRKAFIVAPGKPTTVQVSLTGKKLSGEVSLERLPEGWTVQPKTQSISLEDPAQTARTEFVVNANNAEPAKVHALEVVIRHDGAERRVTAEMLTADAPLVKEAEDGQVSGEAAAAEFPDVSGMRCVAFKGKGEASYEFNAEAAGKHALWLRARWEGESRATLRLRLDEGKPREMRAERMIGFNDWTEGPHAYTKGFLHHPQRNEHWMWYRISEIELSPGKHRLTLGADTGAFLDALLLLPQNPAMDRAAMNLLQNWNYVPPDDAVAFKDR